MVKAIIALRKTQTRRLATSPLRNCKPGDRLWVRETWKLVHSADPSQGARYRADVGRDDTVWRPSIHMPRWASRITLLVDAVRFERLQLITEDDCIAEGIEPLRGSGPNFYTVDMPDGWAFSQPTARPCFEQLWRALHGPKSWESNPDLVAITFRPVAGNIDQVSA